MWSAFARLAARFSFKDLPDFLAMVCRGDLSDIAGPLIWGPVLVPVPQPYAGDADVGVYRERGWEPSQSGMSQPLSLTAPSNRSRRTHR